MRILVLGGGAIGTATAWRLAERGAEVVLVERHAVAGAASGKSGGFLARDWCDNTPLGALARRSFALHAEWAGMEEADWGYRRMDTWSGTLGRDAAATGAGRGRGPAWVGPAIDINGRIGSTDTTAQVHPGRFTAAMARLAAAKGAEIRIGTVTGLPRRGDAVVGAEVDGVAVEADAVVLATGPWSIAARRWLVLPPVWALKGHSMVFDTGDALPAEALFLEGTGEDGGMLSPEVFPRADGTTYACAISSETRLPEDPRAVMPDAGAIPRLRALCAAISPVLAAAPVLAEQACHRPVTADGLPMLGAVPGAPGAFVATGHGVWGILNAPGTAEAMAELVLDGDTRQVNLDAFDPGRFV
ncbi:MAG: FAD-binding oxidoreductase [Gluconacetobacter diazotrophicus]|nr:FAD-binding oxidoreductase [Gluconacetobacter diazotrophicus]